MHNIPFKCVSIINCNRLLLPGKEISTHNGIHLYMERCHLSFVFLIEFKTFNEIAQNRRTIMFSEIDTLNDFTYHQTTCALYG